MITPEFEIDILASQDSPPAFAWDDWYRGVGGRTIDIPEADEYMHKIQTEQYPRFEGEISSHKQNYSPEDASKLIKLKAIEFGADIVGICRIEPSDIYQGRTVKEEFAIAVGQRMKWSEFQNVPSDESAIECLRIYYSLGETVIKLAEFIRSIGYACTVEHPVGDSNVLHIPIGLKAGFGELGRHGSIIHPKLGPLFRMGSVLTSLPMEIDYPIDAGIAKFCDNCRACRIYCPADAIGDNRTPEGGKDHLGNDRYMVDTGKCFPYFAEHKYCSICLPVCVYNHKEWAKDFTGTPTKLFPEIAMETPPPPCDSVSESQKHRYPLVKRGE
ncbi:MAG: hypothetical protein JST20_00225 [Bacteroidetes bacterium]|nr:hypothetical protein [Bacteroidota bacterium]